MKKFRITRKNKPIIYIFLFFLVVLASLFIYVKYVRAVTCNWQSSGSASWNTSGNWSCGHVPTTSDIATFTSAYNTSVTLDANVDVSGINIGSSYSGTFTQGSYTIQVGTGNFVQSSGIFTASTYTFNVKGSITLSGGTFNNGGGTVNLNASTGTQTITCTGSPFNLVTMNQTNFSSTVTISSGCTVPVGTDPTLQLGYINGITVNGALSGSGTLKLKGYNNGSTWYNPKLTLSCGNSSCLSGFSGLDLASANNATTSGIALTISGSGTVFDTSSYSTINISTDSLILSSSASFIAPTGTINIKDSITINPGTTFNANGGTLNFNSSDSAQTVTCSQATNFNFITISTGNQRTFTLGSGCTATLSASHPTIYSPVVINGTLNNSGTANVAYNVTVGSDGIFGGTVNLNSNSSTQTITCSGSPFNLVTMNQTTFSTNVTISSGCTVPVGDNPTLQVGGSSSGLTVNGTLSGSGTLKLKGYNNGTTWYNPPLTLSCGNSSCLSGFTGLDFTTANNNTASYPLTISGAGTSFNANNYSTLKLVYLILSSSAVFTAPSGTMNIPRELTINSGTTFNANGGTINFNGLSGTSLNCGSTTLNNVIINKDQAIYPVTPTSACTMKNLTITQGYISNPASAYTWNVTGDFTQTPNTTLGGANFTLNLSGSSNQAFTWTTGTMSSNLTVNKTAGVVTLGNNLTVGSPRTCTITAGTFDINGKTFACTGGFTVANGGTLRLIGSETPTSPTLSAGSTVSFKGTGSGNTYTITAFKTQYSNLSIDDVGANNFNLGADVTIGKNFTINAGTFNTKPSSTAYNMTVGGNFTNNGTFNQGTGTVTFNDNTQKSTISGSGTLTFNNFTSITPAKLFAFQSDKTININGILTLTGTANNQINLNSTALPVWKINYQGGTPNITYAFIANSGCEVGTNNINLDNTSVSGGNNGACWGGAPGFAPRSDKTLKGNMILRGNIKL